MTASSDDRRESRFTPDRAETRAHPAPEVAPWPGLVASAAALGLSLPEFEKLRSDTAAVRLDSMEECYSDSSSLFAAPEDNAEAVLLQEEDRSRLAEEIGELPERLQLVIQLYFVEELNLSEIAEVLGVSIPRVHQLKASALDKLRLALAD